MLFLNFNGIQEFGDGSFGTNNGNRLHNGAIYHSLHHAAWAYQYTGGHAPGCYSGGEVTISNGVPWQEPGFSPHEAWRKLRHKSRGRIQRELSNLEP